MMRQARDRRFTVAVAFVAVIALAVRLIYLWQIHGAPFFELLIGDGRAYDAWAKQIADGEWLGDQVFYQAPLYPYFLGVIYAVAGADPVAARVCQLMIGVGSCVLIALAGRRWFNWRVGAAAGALMAVYAPAIFFDGLIQKSCLDLLLLSALLYVLGGIALRSSAVQWIAAGVLCGLLALTRENALVLVPVIAVWLVATLRQKRGPCLTLFVAGLVVVLGPVALRNQIVGGEFHLTTSQLGPNLYIGNNPQAPGYYQPLRYGRGDARTEAQDAADLASQQAGRALSPAEVSRFWTQQVFQYIKEQPGDWFRLMLRKCRLLLADQELTDAEDQYTYADHAPILKACGWVFRWGVLAPLAVLGAIVSWRRQRRRQALLYALPIALAASVVLFYVMARYRYPLTPFVILFAAAGLYELMRAVRRRNLRPSLVAGAVAAVVTAIIAWPNPLPPQRLRATALNNIASEMMYNPENHGDARRMFDQVLQLQPDYALAHNNLAVLLVRQRQFDAALHHYRKAIEFQPDFVDAHYNSAVLLGSAEHYLVVLRLDPNHANAHNNLASLLERAGREDDAIAHYRAALAADPAHREAANNLGALLAHRGNLTQGITLLEKAIRLNPAYIDAHYNLGLALLKARRFDEAARQFSIVLELQPDDPAAQRKLNEAQAAGNGNRSDL